jgi:uncharacterized protein (TIGR02246 family)
MAKRKLGHTLGGNMIIRAFFTAAALAALVPPAQAQSAVKCARITKTDVEKLFDRWNASLKTADPEKVADNYAEDAVLLPTVSNKPRLTRAERVEYFKEFLKKEPVGAIDSRVIKIGCNSVVDAGLYTFTLHGHDQVHARYTFTYEFKNGKWVIAHHHSSAMPEKPAS